MPRKHVVKEYEAGGIYHIHNLCICGAQILYVEEDYEYLMYLLEEALTENPSTKAKAPKNFHSRIDIFCFILQNNHWHFEIKQNDKTAMAEFMQSLTIRFTMKMNKKYKRSGPLFHSRYQARKIESVEDAINVSKYIHLNPTHGEDLRKDLTYPYSSVTSYLSEKQKGPTFLDTNHILELFDFDRHRYLKFLMER